MIVIVDLNIGNLGSLQNMLKKVGTQALISAKLEDIQAASKLILAGVGSFDTGMTSLQRLGLMEILKEKVLQQKTPLLGICLGMQLLTKKSEEGTLPGLGFMDAETVKFKFAEPSRLKIPHMGWNTVDLQKKSLLFKGMEPQENRFYFVHSYHVACHHPEDILTMTTYGTPFVSAVEKGNILGVQFHPEKSHKFGIQLFKNFVENF